jgi:hypothetical protein
MVVLESATRLAVVGRAAVTGPSLRPLAGHRRHAHRLPRGHPPLLYASGMPRTLRASWAIFFESSVRRRRLLRHPAGPWTDQPSRIACDDIARRRRCHLDRRHASWRCSRGDRVHPAALSGLQPTGKPTSDASKRRRCSRVRSVSGPSPLRSVFGPLRGLCRAVHRARLAAMELSTQTMTSPARAAIGHHGGNIHVAPLDSPRRQPDHRSSLLRRPWRSC